MNASELKARLFAETWLITPAALTGLLSALDGITAAKQDGSFREKSLATIENGDATVNITGPLVPNVGWIGAFLGICDTAQLNATIEQLLADSNVKRIVLRVDSPGGSISLIPETASLIAGASKPVIAYAAGAMASAAYWLAAGADKIYAGPSSEIGSIGVVAQVVDTSAALERGGVKVETFTSGKFKGAGFPGTSLTAEQKEMLQGKVDEIAGLFKSHVARHRPKVSAGTMEGQSMFGASALNAGLVDGLANTFRAAMAGQFTASAQSTAAEPRDEIAELEAKADEYAAEGRVRFYGADRGGASSTKDEIMSNTTEAAVVAAGHGDAGVRKNLLETLEQEWRSSSELQSQYITAGSYAAYQLAVAQGRQQEIRS